MNFHHSSFLLGASTVGFVFAARHRLKPIAVEVASFGLHIYKVGRGALERQREDIEDFWAEVEDRTQRRSRVRPRGKSGTGGRRTVARNP